MRNCIVEAPVLLKHTAVCEWSEGFVVQHSFPKLLRILMAVMNQIPLQILVHKTKLGRENSAYLYHISPLNHGLLYRWGKVIYSRKSWPSYGS